MTTMTTCFLCKRVQGDLHNIIFIHDEDKYRPATDKEIIKAPVKLLTEE